MVYAVDRGMEKLRATLDDPNGDGNDDDSVAGNTLIVFLSDNGGKVLQAGNNAPLRDDKGSTHEGAIRVPMFAHWPGTVPAGKVFDHPVLALDFYPTFAALAGAEIPAEKKLDGKNVWPAFLDGRAPHGEDEIFWLRHHGGGNEVAIRKGNLKAYRKQFGRWAVHDVLADPGENVDLAEGYGELLEALVAAGREWSTTLVDPAWHDTEAGAKSWETNDMPKYERTFDVP